MLYEMTDYTIMQWCGISVKRANVETAVAVTQGKNTSEREERSRQTWPTFCFDRLYCATSSLDISAGVTPGRLSSATEHVHTVASFPPWARCQRKISAAWMWSRKQPPRSHATLWHHRTTSFVFIALTERPLAAEGTYCALKDVRWHVRDDMYSQFLPRHCTTARVSRQWAQPCTKTLMSTSASYEPHMPDEVTSWIHFLFVFLLWAEQG